MKPLSDEFWETMSDIAGLTAGAAFVLSSGAALPLAIGVVSAALIGKAKIRKKLKKRNEPVASETEAWLEGLMHEHQEKPLADLLAGVADGTYPIPSQTGLAAEDASPMAALLKQARGHQHQLSDDLARQESLLIYIGDQIAALSAKDRKAIRALHDDARLWHEQEMRYLRSLDSRMEEMHEELSSRRDLSPLLAGMAWQELKLLYIRNHPAVYPDLSPPGARTASGFAHDLPQPIRGALEASIRGDDAEAIRLLQQNPEVDDENP